MMPVQSIVTFNRVTNLSPSGFFLFLFFLLLSVNGINKQGNSRSKEEVGRITKVRSQTTVNVTEKQFHVRVLQFL